MIGDRSSWINFAIALASSTFVAYFIYLSRKNDYPETLRQSTAPAIEQFQRFRDESLRKRLKNLFEKCHSFSFSAITARHHNKDSHTLKTYFFKSLAHSGTTFCTQINLSFKFCKLITSCMCAT